MFWESSGREAKRPPPAARASTSGASASLRARSNVRRGSGWAGATSSSISGFNSLSRPMPGVTSSPNATWNEAWCAQGEQDECRAKARENPTHTFPKGPHHGRPVRLRMRGEGSAIATAWMPTLVQGYRRGPSGSVCWCHSGLRHGPWESLSPDQPTSAVQSQPDGCGNLLTFQTRTVLAWSTQSSLNRVARTLEVMNAGTWGNPGIRRFQDRPCIERIQTCIDSRNGGWAILRCIDR
jgi:hypothetical protein